MLKILDNVYFWLIFRKTTDLLFGLYRKRMAVIRSLGITEEMSILDIGCGIGQYSILTKTKYLGIDLSNEYIEYAKKLHEKDKNRKFVCADVNSANITNSSFDVALLIDTLHHLSNEENKKLFDTLNRVASNYIVICDPIKQKQTSLIGRFLVNLDRGHYIRSKGDLIQMVQEVFIVEKIVELKIMGVESICILAHPQAQNQI